MSQSQAEDTSIVYAPDERPPFGRSLVYALQHIFAMILGSITGGMLLAETVGLSSTQTGQLIGYINFAVGIATILQVRWGIKLPLIQGSTSGHLPAYLALGAVGVSMQFEPTVTMQYIGGALLIGAIIELVFGALNIFKWVIKWFSPLTVGIVITMVGLGLWPIVNDFIGDGWPYAISIIALVMLFSFAFGTTIKTMSLFLAVLTAYAIALCGTYFGWFAEGHVLFVKMQNIGSAQWLNVPKVFPWGTPKFDWGFILAMTIPYLATALESFGDYVAVANTTKQGPLKVKDISRGIGFEGLGSVICSCLGGTATSSFSQNVGVVRMSGVASRFVCIVAGALLILIGLFGKFGSFLAEIPKVVLGAVYLTAFGILVMTGFRLILKAKVKTFRNEMIIGTSLLIGLSLPQYMKENPVEFDITSLNVFLNVFFGTPMMVAGAWAFLLDNILPGSLEERGISNFLQSMDKEKEVNEKEG